MGDLDLLRLSSATFRGVWRSRGYNILLNIMPDGYAKYDITQISCLLSEKGTLDDLDEAYDRIEWLSPDSFSMFYRGGLCSYAFDRQSGLLECCKSPETETAHDPRYVFDVFWRYFQENYAFFDVRKVDWAAVYAEYFPKIGPETGEGVLVKVLGEIIKLFKDAHIKLKTPEKVYHSAPLHPIWVQWQKEFGLEKQDEIYRAGFSKLLPLLQAKLLPGSRIAANKKLLWGRIRPNIGYLHVAMMDGFAGDDCSSEENLAALNAALDQVMDDFSSLDGAIVDVRFNPGGEDNIALSIASRFTDRRRLAFSKKAVDGASFTKEQFYYLNPGKTSFTKPVVLLTSRSSVSAAEVLAMCMMPLPNVTRIGEPTQGVFSDVFFRQLPNGWQIKVPDEVYSAADGIVYEGLSIPPQIYVPVFGEGDFYQGLDLVLDTAVSFIASQPVG